MNRRGFGFRRAQPDQQVPAALQRAHELMEAGRFSEAAEAFERLAAAAEGRQGPRAPFFFMQAGRARLQLRETARAMGHLRHGLELLAEDGRYHQLYRAGASAIRELKARGLDQEARELTGVMQTNIPAISESPTQRLPHPDQIKLPSHCPHCGGPLRADEVDWIDAASAECTFCGSPVQIEN